MDTSKVPTPPAASNSNPVPRPKQNGSKWIAVRTPHGELVSVEEIREDHEILAAEAGLQGLSLADWLLTIHEASADHEEEEGGDLNDRAADRMGNWIEIPWMPNSAGD